MVLKTKANVADLNGCILFFRSYSYYCLLSLQQRLNYLSFSFNYFDPIWILASSSSLSLALFFLV